MRLTSQDLSDCYSWDANNKLAVEIHRTGVGGVQRVAEP